MDDLDQLPETSFEKDIVCEDEEAFCLSKENIDSLRVLLHQVQMFHFHMRYPFKSYRRISFTFDF